MLILQQYRDTTFEVTGQDLPGDQVVVGSGNREQVPETDEGTT